MDPGSPRPSVSAGDGGLTLTYVAEHEKHVRITFVAPLVHYFGPPDDETLEAHPLAAAGLTRHAAFETHNSRWVEELRTMNRAHPQHSNVRFDRLRHFIWTFHDSTFECLAENFAVDFA